MPPPSGVVSSPQTPTFQQQQHGQQRPPANGVQAPGSAVSAASPASTPLSPSFDLRDKARFELILKINVELMYEASVIWVNREDLSKRIMEEKERSKSPQDPAGTSSAEAARLLHMDNLLKEDYAQ
jgi:hypothetical protein